MKFKILECFKTTKTESQLIKEEFKEYISILEDDEKRYIENRLINQIIWYSETAKYKQWKYKILTIISISMTALIPVITLFTHVTNGFVVSIIISVLSSLSALISSVINLCEYQRLWIRYRTTCEILKSILYRYLTKTREFSSNNKLDNLELLISMSEEYLMNEYQTWTELPHKEKQE